MIRPFLAYSLTAIILLSQTGLPVHMHYCKGMLESVSVFVSSECDNHEEIPDLPACCQKFVAATCEKDDNCCDDEVAVLLQDIDSLMPHFAKWDVQAAINNQFEYSLTQDFEYQSPEIETHESSNSGPPIYILFHSLIYYA